ncbi:MAG: methyltransferase [Rhodobacteraceae bacterium]|nr:methyltransferase [Paracoccaceae bacterium]
MDPVLLAATVPARPGQSVLELGCGVGVASLCLAARVPGLRLHGLEVQPPYGALARRNAAASGIDIEIHIGDLARMPPSLAEKSFDHVILNPPYFTADDGTPAMNKGREAARREVTPFAVWIATALRRLKPRGWLTVVQASERLPELLVELGTFTGSTIVVPVAPRSGKPAKRILARTCKGGRGPFRLHPPLILHEGDRHVRDGDDLTPAASAILRRGEALRLE